MSRWTRRDLLGKISLSAASCLVTVGVLECCLRVTYQPPLTPSCVVTHPTRLYALKAGCRGRTLAAPLYVNRLGSRGAEVTVDPGALRIAVYGDSMTFGQGVADTEVFTEHIARRLSGACARTVQVFNLGVPSYNTRIEYQHFLDTFEILNPQVVVFQYTAENDSIPARRVRWWEMYSAMRAVKDVVRGLYLYDWVVRRYLGWRTRLEVRPTGALDAIRARVEALHRDGQPGWEETKMAFGQLARFAASRGLVVLVVLVVNTYEVAATTETDPWAPLTLRVARTLKGLGLDNVVVADELLRPYSRPQDRLWLSPSDHHFSVSAHRVVGNGLADRLLEILGARCEAPQEGPAPEGVRTGRVAQ